MSKIRIPKLLCGIIGHPLGHSLSPLLHNHAFELLGIDAAYMAWPTPPEGLGRFMDALRTLPIHGVSVTIPHKVAVMGYLDGVTELAKDVGAVNTLYWDGDRLLGENSDVTGFMRPLEGYAFASAMILGAGGVSRAAVAGLRRMGVREIFITNRSPEKAEALAGEFGLADVPWERRTDASPDLLVNATPLGMAGERAALSPWPKEAFRTDQTCYDLVYNPLRTRFLREAEAAGCKTVDGLGMFIHQAAVQFELWTGQKLPLEESRALLMGALGLSDQSR